MKHRVLGPVLGIVTLALVGCGGESPAEPTPQQEYDYRGSLRDMLEGLAAESNGDPWLQLHFRSIIQVMEAGDRGSQGDTDAVRSLWQAFASGSTAHSPRLRASYLDRSRPLIVAWVSPTDGRVSFTWLTLPARWAPEREYPLYVQLHGLWDVAQDPLPYLAYPYSNVGTSFAFEDGYLLSPWGRGNQWYRGVAETDIWEGIAAVKRLVRVDAERQYLCGHSMGGSGAWHIAQRSAGAWAALGIHAGALGYDVSELTASGAQALRDLPTYFVVGTQDGLFSVNETAHALLRDAGNPHLAFVIFSGGHEYRQQDVEQMYLWLRGFDRHGPRQTGQ